MPSDLNTHNTRERSAVASDDASSIFHSLVPSNNHCSYIHIKQLPLQTLSETGAHVGPSGVLYPRKTCVSQVERSSPVSLILYGGSSVRVRDVVMQKNNVRHFSTCVSPLDKCSLCTRNKIKFLYYFAITGKLLYFEV